MAAHNDAMSAPVDFVPGVEEQYKTVFKNGRFNICWMDFQKPGPGGLVKFMWEGTKAAIPKNEELDRYLPVKKPDFDALNSHDQRDGISVTWLGHACVLVQIEGFRVLTDPIFSCKCGPIVGCQVGPRRYRNAPCSVAELPMVDAVVISHNHYDHLDLQTVKDLNSRFGENLTWFVPKGVKRWMEEIGCRKVEELEWWERRSPSNNPKFKFVFVPAQHWSKRTIADDNKTLFGGWCVLGEKRRFYFAGDTGYHDGLFKEIGKHLGPFDLAAIPIGAYSPRWFMQCQHNDPEEALKIHSDVKAKKSIGVHWGTFNLSSEPYLEPRNRIKEMQDKEHSVDKDPSKHDFFTIFPGESEFCVD